MHIWRRRNGVQNIGARLNALRSDFLALQEDVRGLADGVSEAASDAYRTTNETADAALETVGDWTNDNMGSLRDQMRRQPLATVVLSMGAGALIGALFLRR